MKHKICKEYVHFYKLIFIKIYFKKYFDLLGQF
jgi:hypothetical protein